MNELGLKIREAILENNEKIHALLEEDIFALNKEVSKLLRENRVLQENCPHEYNEKNECIYCFKKEKKV